MGSSLASPYQLRSKKNILEITPAEAPNVWRAIMQKMCIICFICLIVLFANQISSASPQTLQSQQNTSGSHALVTTQEQNWRFGISLLSPGLPIAFKTIYQQGNWGLQIEANYFYLLGMLRLDAKRVLREFKHAEVYGFTGLTGSHFNDVKTTINPINNTLMADLGIGGEMFFGKRKQWGIGIEGGLLVPFWSNLGLEQYDNSGLLVANAFCTYSPPGHSETP